MWLVEYMCALCQDPGYWKYELSMKHTRVSCVLENLLIYAYMCRCHYRTSCLFATQGYVLCNLDKLVLGLVQNLYRASSDKIFSKLVQLYYYERSAQPDGVVPSVYRNHVQQLLRRSDKEVCGSVDSLYFHSWMRK